MMKKSQIHKNEYTECKQKENHTNNLKLAQYTNHKLFVGDKSNLFKDVMRKYKASVSAVTTDQITIQVIRILMITTMRKIIRTI